MKGSWGGPTKSKVTYVPKKPAAKVSATPEVHLELSPNVEEVTWKPTRIVSGGQTGADRGGLMAGAKLNIPTAGWMPNGYKCDDRIGAQVAKTYNLMESDGGYAKRDRQNADMSDAIIGFLLDKPLTGRGTTITIRYFINGKMDYVPYTKKSTVQLAAHNVALVWDLNAENKEEIAQSLRTFINQVKPKSLMIAGPCERTDVGLADLVCEVLCLCFNNNAGTTN